MQNNCQQKRQRPKNGAKLEFVLFYAASRMRILHALAASCVQSLQFFANTMREQLFELKSEDAIKK
jgi:hypothetical protein